MYVRQSITKFHASPENISRMNKLEPKVRVLGFDAFLNEVETHADHTQG